VSELAIDGVGKRFGEGAQAKVVLDGVSFRAPKGEIVALLGPSGSGKTTLLRIVAGFESADAGEIRWGGERIDPLPPEKRDFGMVFQHYALFPHMSVGENVAFGIESRQPARFGGLEARRRRKREIAARVAAALARVDLAGFEKRRVGEISGGQQQRVALARALAPEPRVLLLDEPLSNLDPTLRERTRRELAETLRRIGITTLLVTHEQEEAFDLGDRVALLHGGRLDQIGTPQALYREPATRFVASFMGRASFVGVEVVDATGGANPVTVVSGPGLRPGAVLSVPQGGFRSGDEADLWLRPEMLEPATGPAPSPLLSGSLQAARFSGAVSYGTVRLSTGEEVEVLVGGDAPDVGAELSVRLRPDARPRLFAREPRE
jgi:ABC-type Fe3+/spermidine/putrescine transport system ATPase subunit